ncbi:MAG: FG-GAP repeat protein, partial [Myxococcales bacterium]|nr:FG-GAP repeat protein [Myxococcales bacterium]
MATTFAHGQAVLFEFFGDGEFDIQGYSVAGAGDVNADGTPDFIVGVPQLGTTGGARVYSGMDGTLVWSLAGDNDADWFGYSVAGAGDTDCDGYDDLIVGAPFDDNGGEDSGMARVYSGRTGLLLHQFDGASQGYQLGHSVSGVGDVDGDLCTDFVIGSHLEESGGINPGRARVYSGASGAVIYTFEGDDDLDAFGYAVSGAGDVNHDGTPDIAVGALLNDDSHEDAGSVYVFSGLTGAQLHRFDGLGKGEDFGFDVASAGDVDGDDYADVIGGTIFGFAGSVPGAGQARVYSGRTGTEIYRFDGDFLADGLGWSVSDIGDINGDQFGDLVVGAPFNDDNGGA